MPMPNPQEPANRGRIKPLSAVQFGYPVSPTGQDSPSESPPVRQHLTPLGTLNRNPYESPTHRSRMVLGARGFIPKCSAGAADNPPTAADRHHWGHPTSQLLHELERRCNSHGKELLPHDDALDRLMQVPKSPRKASSDPGFRHRRCQVRFSPHQFGCTQDTVFNLPSSEAPQEGEQLVSDGVARNREIQVAGVIPVGLTDGSQESPEILPPASKHRPHNADPRIRRRRARPTHSPQSFSARPAKQTHQEQLNPIVPVVTEANGFQTVAVNDFRQEAMPKPPRAHFQTLAAPLTRTRDP